MGNKEIHERHGKAGSSNNRYQNYLAFTLWSIKEPSHYDDSFELPQKMFFLRSRKKELSNTYFYLEA